MNVIEALTQLLGNINPFQEKTYYVYKDDSQIYTQPKQTPQPVQQKMQPKQTIQPTTQSVQTTIPASPAPMPMQQTQDIDLADIQRKLTNGFINLYGSKSPALQYIPQIMKAIETNDFHKKNPFIAAAQQVLETSGGLNITRPNNVTNWGINFPGNNEAFSQMNSNEVFDRYLTGIGERDPNYKEFRTGLPLTKEESVKLGKKYAPDDTTYGERLFGTMNYFQNQ